MLATVTDPIVRALAEHQDKNGLSGDEFARRLGVTPAMWSYVRRGERRPGRKLLFGAARISPEIGQLVVRELTMGSGVADE